MRLSKWKIIECFQVEKKKKKTATSSTKFIKLAREALWAQKKIIKIKITLVQQRGSLEMNSKHRD